MNIITKITRLFKPYVIIGEWEYDYGFDKNIKVFTVKKYRVIKSKKHIFDFNPSLEVEYYNQ